MEVIITGGWGSKTKVSVYSKAGHQRDLADLNTVRYLHACSRFIFEENKVKVTIGIKIFRIIHKIVFIFYYHYQLLMVTGGMFSQSSRLDTTEVYKDNVWRTVTGRLPLGLRGQTAISVNNRVLLLGRL